MARRACVPVLLIVVSTSAIPHVPPDQSVQSGGTDVAELDKVKVSSILGPKIAALEKKMDEQHNRMVMVLEKKIYEQHNGMAKQQNRMLEMVLQKLNHILGMFPPCEVRGFAWCTDATGAGGNCCAHYSCSLEMARTLPDPDGIATGRPSCYYSPPPSSPPPPPPPPPPLPPPPPPPAPCDGRGVHWCTDNSGEGGNCCAQGHCSLDQIRTLPDPDGVAAERPVCWYRAGGLTQRPHPPSVSCALFSLRCVYLLCVCVACTVRHRCHGAAQVGEISEGDRKRCAQMNSSP